MERFLILASSITRCTSISYFTSLLGIPAIGLKICVITVGIEKYKSIIEKKKQDKKKHC